MYDDVMYPKRNQLFASQKDFHLEWPNFYRRWYNLTKSHAS